MRKQVRIFVLATLAVVIAAVTLMPGRLSKRADQVPAVFVAPNSRATTLKEYLNGLWTLNPATPGARVDGYIYVGGSIRMPIYRVQPQH